MPCRVLVAMTLPQIGTVTIGLATDLKSRVEQVRLLPVPQIYLHETAAQYENQPD